MVTVIYEVNIPNGFMQIGATETDVGLGKWWGIERHRHQKRKSSSATLQSLFDFVKKKERKKRIFILTA